MSIMLAYKINIKTFNLAKTIYLREEDSCKVWDLRKVYNKRLKIKICLEKIQLFYLQDVAGYISQ